MEMVCRRVPDPRPFRGIENTAFIFEAMPLMSPISSPLLDDVKHAAACPDTMEFGQLRQLWTMFC
jgi:hypothetical protein